MSQEKGSVGGERGASLCNRVILDSHPAPMAPKLASLERNHSWGGQALNHLLEDLIAWTKFSGSSRKSGEGGALSPRWGGEMSPNKHLVGGLRTRPPLGHLFLITLK